MSVACGTVLDMPAATSTRNGAVRLRLDVAGAQAQQLLSAAGARRYAYNWALGRIAANHEQWQAEATYGIGKQERTRPFSFFDLVKQWDQAKREHTPWFGEHSTWTFRYAIRSAARAHADFLSGKTKFPRFKSRHRDRPRFTVTDGVHLEAGRVRVAKYGWFPIAAPCRAQARLRRLLARGRARLMNVTVTRHSDGHWYATVCFEQQVRSRPEDHTAPAGPVVGVDVGVRTAAVVATADGTLTTELVASRALRDSLRRVKHLQRGFARTQKGSANRRKAADRLARAHARVAARRADRLHTFTARLARRHSVVVVEDLAVANMLRNHHLAAAISDQGWGELRRQLAYKTSRHGGQLVVADRFYPSTKTCSSCGAVKAKLPLSMRTYTCGTCGLVLDRDVNAAANLAAWGERHLTVPASQVGDRHPGGPSAENLRHACGGDNEPAPVLAGAPVEAGTSQHALTGVA
jgi:putative transposase